jgi:hypothetical protein
MFHSLCMYGYTVHVACHSGQVVHWEFTYPWLLVYSTQLTFSPMDVVRLFGHLLVIWTDSLTRLVWANGPGNFVTEDSFPTHKGVDKQSDHEGQNQARAKTT